MGVVNEIETLRAALLYWREEVSPYGEAAGQPYFDRPEVRPLSSAEIDTLRAQLAGTLRYVGYDPLRQQLLGTTLWESPEEARRQVPAPAVAVILLLPQE